MHQRLLRGYVSLAFPSLTFEQLIKVTPDFEISNYKPGTIIFQHGDIADKLCIVIEGKIEIVEHLPSHEKKIIAQLEPGQYFDETGLMAQKVQSRTIRAANDIPNTAIISTKSDILRELQWTPV
ncbi:MAG: cyclic nucleotide-binding domain-containing protein [Chloroflexota bacterium]